MELNKELIEKNIIELIKDKMSLTLTFLNSIEVRLFLLRCNRKEYFKHIGFYGTGTFLPKKYLDRERIEKLVEKYYLNKKLEEDISLVQKYTLLKSYSIKLDSLTFLSITSEFEDKRSTNRLSLTFYGKNIRKYVYFLYRTFEDYKNLIKRLPNKCRIVVGSADNCKIENLTDLKNGRTFNDYIIDKEKINEIMSYIHNALNISKRFEDKFNMTYSPGLIFYGSPGTGKSTIIDAIASELNATVVYVDLLHIKESIDMIYNEARILKKNKPGILVYEDIDFLFKDRDAFDDLEYKDNYNTLLQLLDGYLTIPNTINIATTNHIENLDEALIRDGRFDLKIELKGLNKSEAVRMCEMYDISPDIILKDAEFPINPAFLQKEILIKSKEATRGGK